MRPQLSRPAPDTAHFNPRTRTGCDMVTRTISKYFEIFQSTHPHGVRLIPLRNVPQLLRISIHAPARGATADVRALLLDQLNFNPRTRTGCDSESGTRWGSDHHFNPRTRTGCDHLASVGFCPLPYFNPRTRTGCDPKADFVATPTCDFNPRTRTGCDNG